LKKLTEQFFGNSMSVTLKTCEDLPDYNSSDALEIANLFSKTVNKWESEYKKAPSLSTCIAAAILWMLAIMEAQFPNDED
jgi:hypothetical protein